ncbi:MAG: recombinase family protein, partial [Hyphomicrobiales bacterium]
MDKRDAFASRGKVRAAQYLRMSTERQIYSTAGQAESIAAYAREHDFEIVRSFVDHGRSGLRLAGRAALQELLDEVVSGDADFQAVLVYDVSRWGRYQDIDESAHYEYICRRAGVAIHYCAEAFNNDGSMTGAVLKILKRAMAGEYSRELSTKIFRAQARLVERGYWVGAKAPYGLRRMLIDREGKPGAVLAAGERKAIVTDRVVLVPGPEAEIRTVRLIFRLAGKGLNCHQIARYLNTHGCTSASGGGWHPSTVRRMIANDVYQGKLVFKRRSNRLSGPAIDNPPAEWITKENAVAPLVTSRIFAAAQAKGDGSRQRWQGRIIDSLAGLLDREGYLSSDLINRSRDVPTVATCCAHFGSLKAIYKLLDYVPGPTRHSAPRAPLSEPMQIAIRSVVDAITAAGGTVSSVPGSSRVKVDEKT